MAQDALFEIGLTAIGVVILAVIITGNGINRQVTTSQILLQGDIRCGVTDETGITFTGFSFCSRQCIFLMTVRMQENREITPDLSISQGEHLLRGGTDHHPVFIFQWQIQQFITNRTTDKVRFHCTSPE